MQELLIQKNVGIKDNNVPDRSERRKIFSKVGALVAWAAFSLSSVADAIPSRSRDNSGDFSLQTGGQLTAQDIYRSQGTEQAGEIEKPKEKKALECFLKIRNGKLELVYTGEAKERFSIELDLPKSDKISIRRFIRKSRPMLVSCQPDRGVVVTEEFVIRAVGTNRIENGIPIIGTLKNGKIYFQNAIVLSIGKEIKPTASTILGSIVELEIQGGSRYRIDVDDPSQNAKLVSSR